jgi:hypothetical protein
MKNLTRYTFLIVLGVIIGSNPLFAQQQQMPPQPKPLSADEISKEDLQMVAHVSSAIQNIQMEADKKVRSMLKEEEMEYTRFQEIMRAQQNPQAASKADMTEDEKATLQKVQPKLMQISQETRQQYMGAIEDEGLTPQKFQQLAQAIQTNPEVAKRFEEVRTEMNEAKDGNKG